MQLAGIHKSKYFDTSKKVVIAFGADHGVYEEGVAPVSYTHLDVYKRQVLHLPKTIKLRMPFSFTWESDCG